MKNPSLNSAHCLANLRENAKWRDVFCILQSYDHHIRFGYVSTPALLKFSNVAVDFAMVDIITSYSHSIYI